MAKVMTRNFKGTIEALGPVARDTLETFILNQLGTEASADLETTVDATNIKKAVLFWNRETDTVSLDAFFAESGYWTSE